MSHQFIQQPDGKWCAFSSVVDAIVLYDADEEGLIEHYAEEAAEAARKRVRETLDKIKAGERPYAQFTKSFDDAVRMTRGSGYAWPPPETDGEGAP